ncbi:PfkB family carbohydrate kinase [Kitasatospora phosalacinea]|uniref:PfkB family carbohydrate kinase n=1 Tax=Kitasatospora phosalacinea TaxID=2065 RepID=UPI000527C405|nr:PfkB family carbohydrate kinase [Kitasatospora phosalacinea]
MDGRERGSCVVVVGQVGRDLVLRADGLPEAGGSAGVGERWEGLGGKGANQAVGLAQLGVPVHLVGVVGEDDAGAAVLRQAGRDGIGTASVARRGRTALLVDLVDAPGSRRLLEDVPPEGLVTVADLERARPAFADADTVSLQLQQPPATLLAAARRARQHGARVVADGAPDPAVRDELLSLVDVLRADATEAELLADRPVGSVRDARALGRRLLGAGPALVALAVPGAGDLLVWPDGEHLLPLADVPVTDPTGAGDAFVAGLVAALRRRADPVSAGRLAAAAAGATVQRLGGRPDLSGSAAVASAAAGS